LIFQRWIKNNILESFNVSEYAKGFVKGTSIYDNALPHVNKDLVINLDLKNFFPTISYSDVFKLFKYIGYTTEVSHLLTQLCTNGKNRLPQGSPASPNISNLICLSFCSASFIVTLIKSGLLYFTVNSFCFLPS